VRLPLDLKGRTWVRFEIWDIAANGAFTQPLWLVGHPGNRRFRRRPLVLLV